VGISLRFSWPWAPAKLNWQSITRSTTDTVNSWSLLLTEIGQIGRLAREIQNSHFAADWSVVGQVSIMEFYRDTARLFLSGAEDYADLFRTQGFCMVFANIQRTTSSALPARHERSSVLTVEAVVR
jgi:hypothetical protein